MIDNLKKTIENIVFLKYNIKVKPENSKLKSGLSLPLFSISKEKKLSPLVIYNELKDDISVLKYVNQTSFLNGFLNIDIDYKLFSYDLINEVTDKGSNYGSKKENNKTIVIDYSSPNIAKAFHFGHIRSTIIGNSLKLIYRKAGFKVIGINHLGDWGFPFGKILAGYKMFSSLEKIKENPVDELQNIYTEYSKLENDNLEYKQLARDEFAKLENGDESRLKLWELFRGYSLSEFMKTYNLLNIEFDSYLGEAFFNDKMESVVQKLINLNLTKIDDGALIVPLVNKTPILLKKNDGATLYITRDLAAIYYRYNTYHFDKILYVVGSEQKLHFEQLKDLTLLMGDNFDISHVNFGIVLLMGKKMSSRDGKSIKLMDVIDESRHIIIDNLKDLTNSKETATKLAIAAIIYNDLKNDRVLDIDFDLSKMLKFEGNTGVYLMYSLARINSILDKNPEFIKFDENNNKYSLTKPLNINDFNIFSNSDLFDIVFTLSLFSEVIDNCLIDNSPAYLARYLYNLCQLFSSFYAKYNIKLSVENEKLVLLSLLMSIRVVLIEGFRLLGIQSISKM